MSQVKVGDSKVRLKFNRTTVRRYPFVDESFILKCQTEIVMSDGTTSIYSDGPLTFNDCFPRPSGVAQRGCQISVGLKIIGTKFHGISIRLNRLIKPILILQRTSEIEMSLRKAWLNLDRPTAGRLGFE